MSSLARAVPLVVALGAVACRSPAESQRTGPSGAPRALQSSPASDEFRAYCATRPCRRNTHFVLRRADGTTYEMTSPLGPPPLQEGVLSLLPGETIHVEVEQKGDDVVLSRVVTAVEHPERTLTFEFSQMDGRPNMLLSVKSPLARPLKYDLVMMLLEDRVVPTSTCPVTSAHRVFETWPHPIFQLFASRFRLLDVPPDGSMRCE